MKIFRFMCVASAAIASVSQVSAQQEVRGVKPQKEANKVIDEKCLRCHNRQLIDEAVKERQAMEKVLQKMEKKGAVLTDRERRVMGHFWGQPVFKVEKPQEGQQR